MERYVRCCMVEDCANKYMANGYCQNITQGYVRGLTQ